MNFPDDSVGKEFAFIALDTGDVGSVPGLGRCPGGGHGNSLRYFCLENPVDRGTWQAEGHRITKSLARLK